MKCDMTPVPQILVYRVDKGVMLWNRKKVCRWKVEIGDD